MQGELSQILSVPADVAAPRLLGSELLREVGGKMIRVKIVETEAYDQTDEASHSFHGITPRTAVMFGPAGFLYVYFTYGMHFCMNVVTGPHGYGAAALIRAVEPIEGEDIILKNRRGKTGVSMTNGPAKVCQALQIQRDFNGHDLSSSPLKLILKPAMSDGEIIRSPRVGISRAIDKLWRFSVANNKFVSQPNRS